MSRDNHLAQQAERAGGTKAAETEVLLTTPEAASYLRVSKSYLDKLRVYGGGPDFLRLGRRKILYCRSDLENWAQQRRFASTSQYSF